MKPPEFGTKLDGLDTGTPGVILYGVTPDDKVIPVKVTDNGTLDVGVTLAGDVEIGAVELKDGDSDTRVTVKDDGTDNAVVVTANVLPLPTGAATEATLSEIDQDLTDGTQKTQIVDSGGDVVNSTSNSLDINLKYAGGTSITTGQKTSALSIPVVLPSDQTISVGVINVDTIDVVVPALVVTGTISSLTNSVQIEINGHAGLAIQLAGTWLGTVAVETSIDNAATWEDAYLVTVVPGGPIVTAATVAGNGTYRVLTLDGVTHARVHPHEFTSGTIEVTATATAAASEVKAALVSLDQGAASVAGFARLRVANPYTLLDSQHCIDSQSFLWETLLDTGGTATHLTDEAAMELTVGPSSGSSSMRRTRERFRYQAGKSQQIIATGVLGSSQVDVVQKIGYYDDLNGVYFQQDETGPSVVMRSSTSGATVESVVAQADWNIDSFDGTGPSGILLDLAKANIFYFELEWLGAGACRVGFSVNGTIYVAHKFNNTNSIDTVYIGTASLPCTYEIYTTGGIGGTASLKQICTSVISEGGGPDFPFHFTATTSNVPVQVTTGQSVVVAIRPKLTYAGIVNRTHTRPTSIDILPVGSQAVSVQVFADPSILGAPSWVDANPYSGIEYSTTTGLTISGGVPIFDTFAEPGKVTRLDLEDIGRSTPLSLDSTGTTQHVVAVVATCFEGTTPVCGSIRWEEFH